MSSKSNLDPETKYQFFGLAAGLVLIGGVFGTVSLAIRSNPIIFADSIDISQSAQNLTFSNNQTYSQLLETHCRQTLELLHTQDTHIQIKFAADVASKTNTISQRNKTQIRNQCAQTAAIPQRFSQSQGTNPTLALQAFTQELKSLRTNGNQTPIALTLFLDAAEPTASTPNTLNKLKTTIQELTKAESIAIAVIGPTAQLHRDLINSLNDIPNTKHCTFEEHQSCTQWAIQTARQLKLRP